MGLSASALHEKVPGGLRFLPTAELLDQVCASILRNGYPHVVRFGLATLTNYNKLHFVLAGKCVTRCGRARIPASVL
jgi:hypothetical protein